MGRWIVFLLFLFCIPIVYSDTINLTTSNNDLIADMYCRPSVTGNGFHTCDAFTSLLFVGAVSGIREAIVQWDITSLPDNIEILNATYYFNVQASYDYTGAETTPFYMYWLNRSSHWIEQDLSDPAFLERECFGATDQINNDCVLDSTFNMNLGSTGWHSISISNSVNQSYIEGYRNFTLAYVSVDQTYDGFRYFRHYAKEHIIEDDKPYVVIEYDLSAPNPRVTSTYSNYTATNTTINFTYSHTADYSNLLNASLWTNLTGTWTLNQTDELTGTLDTSNFTIISIPSGTDISFNVEACNDADNCTFADTNLTASIFEEDGIAPPIAEDLQATSVSHELVLLTWTEPVLTEDYNTSLVFRNGTYLGEGLGSFIDYDVTGLQDYNYSVFTVDYNGNYNITYIEGSTYISVSTPSGDLDSPVISIVYPPNGTDTNINYTLANDDFDIHITTNEGANCSYAPTDVAYASMTPFTSTGGSGGETIPHTNTTGIVEGATYLMYYRCIDHLSNVNLNSTVHHFIVDTNDPPDVVTNIYNSSTGTDFITVTWTEPPDVDHVMLYLNSTFVANTSSNSYSFTNLTNNSWYNITVHPVDAQNNINNTNGSAYFKTDWIDNIPPWNIFNLTNSTVGEDFIVLNWTLPIDPSVYQLLLFYNKSSTDFFNIMNFTTETSFTHSIGLGDWNYTMLSMDNFSNINYTTTLNNTHIVSTVPGDQTPPNITSFYPSQDTQISYPTLDVTIQINTSENAECRWNSNNVGWDIMSPFDSTDSSTHTQPLSASSGESITRYYICEDSAGLRNNVSTHSFTFETDTAPVISQLTPLDGANISAPTIDFRFWLADDHNDIDFCTVGLNSAATGTVYHNVDDLVTGDYNELSIGISYFVDNYFTWQIWCDDKGGNRHFLPSPSQTYNLWVYPPETNETLLFGWADQSRKLLMSLSDLGNLYVRGRTQLEELFVAGVSILPLIEGTNDLILLGQSDNEFTVGSQFHKVEQNNNGCFSYYITGDPNITSDHFYYFSFDTTNGNEIGQTTFNYTDGRGAGWDYTNVVTSSLLVTIENEVSIAFADCEGNDFEHGDSIEFVAFSEPEQVFNIDTNTSGRSMITSQADWNFSQGDIYFGDSFFVNNLDMAQSNITNISHISYQFDKGIAIGDSNTVAQNSSSIAIGKQSLSNGTNSVAIGHLSKAELSGTAVGRGSHAAISSYAGGSAAIASGWRSVATGTLSFATGIDSISFGYNTVATSSESMSIGTGARAEGVSCIAIGPDSICPSANAMAIGYSANASNGATAIARNSIANGDGSIAIGDDSTVSNDYAVAIGRGASTTAQSAICIGMLCSASATAGTGIGRLAKPGSRAVAIGEESSSNSFGSAVGYQSVTKLDNGIALGKFSNSSGDDCTAIGTGSYCNMSNAVAIGTFARAIANNSVAIGFNVTANVSNAVKIGQDSILLHSDGSAEFTGNITMNDETYIRASDPQSNITLFFEGGVLIVKG